MTRARGTVKIEVEVCKGCELCIETCPQESLALSNATNRKGYHYAVLVQGNCTGCINCALVCPDAVITVYRESRSSVKFRMKSELVTVIRNVKEHTTVVIDELPQGRVDV